MFLVQQRPLVAGVIITAAKKDVQRSIAKSNSPYRVLIRDERSSTGLYFRRRLFVNTLVNVVKVDNLHYVMQVTEVTEVIWWFQPKLWCFPKPYQVVLFPKPNQRVTVWRCVRISLVRCILVQDGDNVILEVVGSQSLWIGDVLVLRHSGPYS